MEFIQSEGFIVHAYAEISRNRIYITGRLSDGRSFACTRPAVPLYLYIRYSDRDAACALLKREHGHMARLPEHTHFRTFGGEPCLKISCSGADEAAGLAAALARSHVETFRMSSKPAAAFLTANGIRAGIFIEGNARRGQNVDLVFPDARILPAHTARAPLTVLSLDIETDVKTNAIRAVGLSCMKENEPPQRNRTVIFAGTWRGNPPPEVTVTDTEKELLTELTAAVRRFDPDIVTGWNIIDFDFPQLFSAYEAAKLPFSLGRSVRQGCFFRAEAENDGEKKRSAAVFLPGRQVLDALRLIRTGHNEFHSYTLDAVARSVLGSGKTMNATGPEKLEELDKMYVEDPAAFCRYCQTDADLVLDILEKKELIKHTVARAALTGVSLDKAWTSVVSFEHVYAAELHRKGVLEPNSDARRAVSGAAGGTVLDPLAGLFRQVAVFDFRSLYPSVMRTFNIDPLSYEQARGKKEGGHITAPNGARFSRETGILPLLIGEYFEQRTLALSSGNDREAYVYKILMNSFYGVLGTPKCRYARTELAGAITSFGRYVLLFARDFFERKGFRVLYGDTDSVFVETGIADGTPRAEYTEQCNVFASELNEALKKRIGDEYGVPSCISIRFEKMYRRFFIPRLRADESFSRRHAGTAARSSAGQTAFENRGRAKGYAGFLETGESSFKTEIKGMEAARSDYTPLARRFQYELLTLLFKDSAPGQLKQYIKTETIRLCKGELDSELVFSKRLRRSPEKYTASTPPHVKVARALGWKNRKGTVEYIQTVNGPEPADFHSSPVDYRYYAETQLLPTARAAGAVTGFTADSIIRNVFEEGQLELEL